MENPRRINEQHRWKIDENSMKNRPKSSLEACWALLGPLGVPSWRPWASWEHLGSVLRASWSVLGASRWHPGARRGPHMDSRISAKSSKNRSKITLIFWSMLRCDFDPKMVKEWLPKPSKNDPKKCSICRSFFSSIFGEILGTEILENEHLVYTRSSFS